MIDVILYAEMMMEGQFFQDEENAYIVLADCISTYYLEVRMVIIYSIFADKCNIYVLEIGDGVHASDDAIEIVERGIPLNLETAKKVFPAYKFTEENYGF